MECTRIFHNQSSALEITFWKPVVPPSNIVKQTFLGHTFYFLSRFITSSASHTYLVGSYVMTSPMKLRLPILRKSNLEIHDEVFTRLSVLSDESFHFIEAMKK